MSLSMYQASVPVFTHIIKNTIAIMDKAVAFCAEKKIDPAVLTNYRLAPDMLPYKAQIYILTDQVKGCVARLAGVEVPSYPDTENTFDELKARLVKTAAFAESFKPEQIDGSEARTITLKFPGNEMSFPGLVYLQGFTVPNVYFHATTAYAILRHCGVQIGKMDFLGPPPKK